MTTNPTKIAGEGMTDERATFKEFRAALCRMNDANTPVSVADRVMILSNATFLLDEYARTLLASGAAVQTCCEGRAPSHECWEECGGTKKRPQATAPAQSCGDAEQVAALAPSNTEPPHHIIDAAMDVARFEYGHGVTRASIVAIWKALGSPWYVIKPHGDAEQADAQQAESHVVFITDRSQSIDDVLPQDRRWVISKAIGLVAGYRNCKASETKEAMQEFVDYMRSALSDAAIPHAAEQADEAVTDAYRKALSAVAHSRTIYEAEVHVQRLLDAARAKDSK